MKVENYQVVHEFMETLNNVRNAIKNVEARRKFFKDEDFLCCLSQHKDGSGTKVDLTGCYVAGDMIDATAQVLKVKEKELITTLESLGVDFSSEDLPQPGE